MSKKPPKYPIGFRLGQDEESLVIWQWLQRQKGKTSDILKRALYRSIRGIPIELDEGNEKHRAIIDQLLKMDDEEHARYIVRLAYERLTGLDYITGEPLPQQVQIVEVKTPIIQERVKVVYSGNQSHAIEEPEPERNEAHKQLNDIEW